jgi:hypothetical protein
MQLRALGGVLLLVGCSHPKPQNIVANDAGAVQVPLDRLLPGELAKSGLLVFGFPIPLGMHIRRRFPDSVHIKGSVPLSDLVKHVESHVVAGPPELRAQGRIYKNSRIRGGDPSRIYTVEVDELRGESQLVISDVTPPPVAPGLSEQERWRRAGYNQDGTPIDPLHEM